MNKPLTHLLLFSFCVIGCEVDTTKQATAQLPAEPALAGGAAGVGEAVHGASGAAGLGGSSAAGGQTINADQAPALAGTGGLDAPAVVAGGATSGGATSGGGASVGVPNAAGPRAIDVCKSTNAEICNKFYTPGCIAADSLAGIQAHLGMTAADCTTYMLAQCVPGMFDCSSNDQASAANNQKCLDETSALTCADLGAMGPPESCTEICD